MEQELPVVKISVRNLVEFILREGDIDNRTGTGMNVDAMQLGGKIHRKIQRRMGSDYQAEVGLKYKIEMDGFCLSVEGRADGILKESSGYVVDEIKGILSDTEHGWFHVDGVNDKVETRVLEASGNESKIVIIPKAGDEIAEKLIAAWNTQCRVPFSLS